jgi:carboxymethylenebutenolidase
MKKIYLTLTLLAVVITLKAQDNITVCHTSSMDKFAMMASSKEFKSMHKNPKPFVFVSDEGGQMIKLKCADGTDANAYFIKAKEKTNNWIFVFQEWWGLNDYIKRESERLYKDLGNVNVMALDMYDGKVAADREAASQYVQQYKQDRGNVIVQGALNYAGKDAKVATIGWCFGGGLSMQASLTAGPQAAGCVIYYGMPEEDVNRLKTLNCDVLMIWPTRDKRINKEVVDKFETNMKTAEKKLTVLPYEADHAFANPSNATAYNETASVEAYKNTLYFLKARLK